MSPIELVRGPLHRRNRCPTLSPWPTPQMAKGMSDWVREGVPHVEDLATGATTPVRSVVPKMGEGSSSKTTGHEVVGLRSSHVPPSHAVIPVACDGCCEWEASCRGDEVSDPIRFRSGRAGRRSADVENGPFETAAGPTAGAASAQKLRKLGNGPGALLPS